MSQHQCNPLMLWALRRRGACNNRVSFKMTSLFSMRAIALILDLSPSLGQAITLVLSFHLVALI